MKPNQDAQKNKALHLNKSTISHLNHEAMKSLHGGIEAADDDALTSLPCIYVILTALNSCFRGCKQN
jgi:hypothetical protein